MSLSSRWIPILTGERQAQGLERLAMAGLFGVGRLYGAVQWLRRQLFAYGVLASERFECPVISVGNLSSGGTGKTPMTLWLAEHLLTHGIRPVIVSRGYGQGSKEPVTVVSDAERVLLHPPLAGDEPSLLAQRLPGVPVITGPDRRRCIYEALSRFTVDLVLLDDGFQHLKVQRDLDIVLMDARRPLGNGEVLPRGILREFPSTLRQADLLILTRADAETDEVQARIALGDAVAELPILLAQHAPLSFVACKDGRECALDEIPQPAAAFCGIAQPHAFQQSLEHLGCRLVSFTPFGDHHPFCREDLEQMADQVRHQGGRSLLCTEKEAVKLRGWELELPIYYLKMQICFLGDLSPLVQRVDTLVNG
ncbi:MAG: tetraacyldisaccharide 4'-kinase [Magnetococcales bacterium]|nr:tetraacyldisaccharide 4'-kinase [Magnetococcales bacterium]